MAWQIPLNLPVLQAMDAADFLVTPSNQAAAQAVQRHTAGSLLLLGEKGSGKSHLARVWQQQQGAVRMQGAPLLHSDHPAWLWEDADNGVWDESTARQAFHLLNQVREQAKTLLITARHPPRQWPLPLADLRSRLLALPVAQLTPPDDMLVAGLLLKHVADRQLRLPEDVLHYLLSRCPRDSHAIATLLALLDKEALARGRAITIPFIREIMQEKQDY